MTPWSVGYLTVSVTVQAPTQTTDALNMSELPRRISAAEIDEFAITSDLAHGRAWHVEGEAIKRFAAMTNWNYYEATLRFQKVLEYAGEHSVPPPARRQKRATSPMPVSHYAFDSSEV